MISMQTVIARGTNSNRKHNKSFHELSTGLVFKRSPKWSIVSVILKWVQLTQRTPGSIGRTPLQNGYLKLVPTLLYIQLIQSRTPFGPALSVRRLREMSLL